jgi:hypothetical protein
MPKINSCTFKIVFEFGSIDSRIMQTTVVNGDFTKRVIPNKNNIATVEFGIDLPTQIVLYFTGKNANTDTLVDENGKIVGDMYVKILQVSMDGFELNEKFLHQKMKIQTEAGAEIVTSYIGFNGSMCINMAESDIFSQYLLMNS